MNQESNLKPRKPIYAFILLALVTAVLTFILLAETNHTLNQRNKSQNEQKIESIKNTLDVIKFEAEEAVNHYFSKNENLIELMAMMLKARMEDGVYTGPEVFYENYDDQVIMDGFVVQVKNKEVIYPESEEVFPVLPPEMITNEVQFSAGIPSGTWLNPDSYYFSSRKISGNYYYIDLTPASDILYRCDKFIPNDGYT